MFCVVEINEQANWKIKRERWVHNLHIEDLKDMCSMINVISCIVMIMLIISLDKILM